MANTYTLVGSDSVIIKQASTTRLIDDFVVGDAFTITPQGDYSNVDIGKNNDAVIAYDARGTLAEVVFRVVSGGETDKWLRELETKYKKRPSYFVLAEGDVTGDFGDGVDKGDGEGTIRKLHFDLGAGVPKQGVPFVINYSGDTNQAVATHTWYFIIRNDGFI